MSTPSLGSPSLPLSPESFEAFRGHWNLHPVLAYRFLLAYVWLYQAGIHLRVAGGYRSREEQDRLYAIGRRGQKGEQVVTNAKGGQSRHNSNPSEAIDFTINGREAVEAPKEVVSTVVHVCTLLGLVSGATFKSLYDPGHIELPKP